MPAIDLAARPLPLTPFERYMLADDRPAYPMTFYIEIVLTGRLDADALNDAFVQSLDRHPLLTSTVGSRFLRPVWQPAAKPELVWLDQFAYPNRESSYLDVREQPGLRAWVANEDDETRLLFQFHHAACDGVGAIQWIGDLLASYGIATAASDDDRPKLAEIDPQALALRGQLWDADHPHESIVRSVVGYLRDLAPGIPTAIHSRGLPATEPRLSTPFVSRVLDGRTLRGVKKVASGHRVTANELYCAALFATLRQWNQLCGADGPNTVYRIGMPFTLRTPDHQHISAANVLSYMLANYRAHDVDDLIPFIQDVHRFSQNAFDKQDRACLAWGLTVAGRVPGMLSLITAAPYRFCTAMLANVADVKRQLRNQFPTSRGRCVAGSLTLESLQGAAPTRPGTHLGLSLGTYAGKLFINLNCEPSQFSRTEAHQLADMFVQKVTSMPIHPRSRVDRQVVVERA